MTERIKPEDIPIALAKSRQFEHAWRVYTHPSGYSDAELEAANGFILRNYDNFEITITCPPDPETSNPEIYDKIFAGLLHYNIRYPDNVENRTFKEN